MVRAAVGCRVTVYAQSLTDLLRTRGGATGDGVSPIALPKLSRNDLPALCRELGFTKGAEIGVWKGAFSALLCEANPAMHMLCVDPWESHQAWVDTKNLRDGSGQRVMEQAYLKARARLGPLNCTIVRKFSADAARDVPDGSLDLIYIDGDHGYDAVSEDLSVWAPKVRAGGLVAGHDFRVFSHKPFIHVVRAVTDYTEAHGISPWFVLAGDKTPSFVWVKP